MTVETIEVDTFHASEISSNEWLADSGASRHICNDIRMLWDVRQLEVPVIVRQLVGEVTVTTCGTVRIECENETGAVVQIDLYDTLLVPDLRVNLFRVQKMRQASVRLEYLEELGTIWMVNKSGE